VKEMNGRGERDRGEQVRVFLSHQKKWYVLCGCLTAANNGIDDRVILGMNHKMSVK
jgi:hypothetical protein